MTFENRILVGVEFSSYVKRNQIKLPRRLGERRKIFIRWFFERNGKLSFDQIIKTLSEEVLYIRQATLESIIFNER